MKIAFYKGTRPGVKGIYSRAIRFVTRSKYSHCELVFDSGISASSSFEDKGVRYKVIVYNPDHWDFIELPRSFDAKRAGQWFDEHAGQTYDLLGALHFLVTPMGDDKDKWFCSEAVSAALGLSDPERFDPGSLYSLLKSITGKLDNSFSLLD